jgi:hypothetical protein
MLLMVVSRQPWASGASQRKAVVTPATAVPSAAMVAAGEGHVLAPGVGVFAADHTLALAVVGGDLDGHLGGDAVDGGAHQGQAGGHAPHFTGGDDGDAAIARAPLDLFAVARGVAHENLDVDTGGQAVL